MVETIKALRIILAVNGHLELPNLDDRNIGGLGLSGSKVFSAYSDMFFLSHYKKNNNMVVIISTT